MHGNKNLMKNNSHTKPSGFIVPDEPFNPIIKLDGWQTFRIEKFTD
jgi:hypothetical protein